MHACEKCPTKNHKIKIKSILLTLVTILGHHIFFITNNPYTKWFEVEYFEVAKVYCSLKMVFLFFF
jgi:hypothetical protein